MGKEVQQGILLVVIILAAVIVIDLGNSGISGEAVNRKGTISVAPPVISQYCGLTDWTQHVLSRIPGAVSISQIIDPQDATYQTAVIVTRDINNNERWSLYDFGADGGLSNDDRVYTGGSGQPSGLYDMIISYGPANRKLFWIEVGIIPGVAEIKSCNLPMCSNQITEVSLPLMGRLIQKFLPSLTRDRVYILITQGLGTNIVSCSRDQTNSDWCGGPSTNFITHAGFSAVSSSVVSDSGFSYYDQMTSRETFFSIGNNQIVTLPVGSFQTPITPLLGSGGLGLLLRYDNNATPQQTELLIVDLNTGQSLGIMNIVASTTIAPWFITTSPGLTTFFQNDWSIVPVVFQSKVTGQPAKTVWTETTPSSINGVVPTASGNIVAMKLARPPTFPQDGIVSFDCTP